ncbi:MAG: cell division protein FtsH, partial [Actinomycetota bacterium]
TTGASNDIEKATAIARAMVTEYGMSDRLGALKFGSNNNEPFLGRDMGHQRDYSEDVAAEIDVEVRRLVEEAHDEAWEVLVQYRDVLDDLVLELMDKETLAKDAVLRVFQTVRKRPSRGVWVGNGKRTPSDRPPVMTPAESALLGITAPSAGTRRTNGSSNGTSTAAATNGSVSEAVAADKGVSADDNAV